MADVKESHALLLDKLTCTSINGHLFRAKSFEDHLCIFGVENMSIEIF